MSNLKEMKFFKFASLLILIPILWGLGIYELHSESLSKKEKSELIQFARNLGSKKIPYAGTWKPPGQSESWVMDCSNTVRYFFLSRFELELPRTALDQYLWLRDSGRFTEAPKSGEQVNLIQLRSQLRTGDLLFWENTYNVNRTPPISHVMIYLGKNSEGRMKMFGAGTFGKGEQTENGGLDVYVFDPNLSLGCVKNTKGTCTKESRFVGYGRLQLR
jgi:hypothetical protein